MMEQQEKAKKMIDAVVETKANDKWSNYMKKIARRYQRCGVCLL
jgi:hypothetical protein